MQRDRSGHSNDRRRKNDEHAFKRAYDEPCEEMSDDPRMNAAGEALRRCADACRKMASALKRSFFGPSTSLLQPPCAAAPSQTTIAPDASHVASSPQECMVKVSPTSPQQTTS